jgi:hypothetical protein
MLVIVDDEDVPKTDRCFPLLLLPIILLCDRVDRLLLIDRVEVARDTDDDEKDELDA